MQRDEMLGAIGRCQTNRDEIRQCFRYPAGLCLLNDHAFWELGVFFDKPGDKKDLKRGTAGADIN
jgi:hypothetical protein